jgi:nitrilase
VLLRARAIENLSYVVAAAQGGLHDNHRRTWGHAMLIDAWGHVMQQIDTGVGLVMADLSFDALCQCRARLPALDHRVL